MKAMPQIVAIVVVVVVLVMAALVTPRQSEPIAKTSASVAGLTDSNGGRVRRTYTREYVCDKCGSVLRKDDVPITEEVSVANAADIDRNNGVARIQVTATGADPCKNCMKREREAQVATANEQEAVAREQEKKRIPLLAGANFQAITAVWGEPNSTMHLLGSPGPYWEFQNRPEGYLTKINFDTDHRAEKVMSSPGSLRIQAVALLPETLLKRSPSEIYVHYEQLNCVWIHGGKTYIAVLQSGNGGEVFAKNRRLNPNTGLYEESPSLSPSWQHGDVILFTQWNTTKGIDPTGGLPGFKRLK